MNFIKVAASSRSAATAGAIAGAVRRLGQANVRAIGAAAVNQAIKAVIIARRYLAEEGLDLVCIPSFVDLEVRGEKRTAVQLTVEQRPVDQTAKRERQS